MGNEQSYILGYRVKVISVREHRFQKILLRISFRVEFQR